MTSNPYLTLLDGSVERIMGQLDDFLSTDLDAFMRDDRPSTRIGWHANNEWIYRWNAERLYALAFAHAAPQSRWRHSPEIRKRLGHAFRKLVDAARQDRWYHRNPEKGDPNLDRFCIVPFMEAFMLARAFLHADLAKRFVEKIQGVLDVQVAEYGRPKQPDNPYPNMDGVYCLAMALGHSLIGREEYRLEFERFLDIMERAQFEEGAWTYIDGTNEAPQYHGLNVAAMARIHDLRDDGRALDMLRKSIPYYPQIHTQSGLCEYFTDPWWKHTWGPPGPSGPDLIASVTGDPTNRWIGSLVRRRRNPSEISEGLTSIAGMTATRLWKDAPEKPLPTDVVFLDRNIQGPRGRFADWSWAATARYGGDTVVGAVAHGPDLTDLTALMAVTPEIPNPSSDEPDVSTRRFALGMTPPGTRGDTAIQGSTARFQVEYRMASFRHIWKAEAFPKAWLCRQQWDMGPSALLGAIDIESQEDQDSPAPIVRIRWGRDGQLVRQAPGQYTYGPFRLEILDSDLEEQNIRSAKVCCFRNVEGATELVLSTRCSQRRQRGDRFRVALRISHTEDKTGA